MLNQIIADVHPYTHSSNTLKNFTEQPDDDSIYDTYLFFAAASALLIWSPILELTNPMHSNVFSVIQRKMKVDS